MKQYIKLFLIIPLLFLCNCKKSEKTQFDNLTLTRTDSLHDSNDISSFFKNYKSDEIDTLLLEAILRKSNSFNQQLEFDSVMKYDKLLMQLALKANNLFYQAKGQSYLAFDFKTMYQLDSAFFYYQRSKNTYQSLMDSTQVGKKLLEMGKIQYRKNDYYGAKESLTEALTFFNHKNDKPFVSSCWNELGNNYSSLRDFKNAKECYQKAIEEEESLNEKYVYINNMAVLYINNGENVKALDLLNGLFERIPKGIDSIQLARLMHNRSEAKWNINKSSLELDNYQKALKIRKKFNDKWGLLSSYRSFAEYYEKISPSKALKYLDTLIDNSKKLKIPEAEIEGLEILFRVEPNKLVHRNRYIFLKDSIDLENLKSKNHFAYLKYLDQQEKERLLALEAETAKQENQLAQQKTQKVIFISLISILLIAGSSLFFILRQRHKKEKLKEIYNTEKRISEELHNGLANDVFGLMTRIQGKKNTTEDVIDSLDTIYQTTRQISHKNSAVKTGAAFKEELEYLINTYQNENTTIVSKGLGSIDWTFLGDQKCIALHRSLREILINLKKHANATLVSIQFKKDEKGVHVTYVDNGVGLKDSIHHGIGLAHIKSRIQSVGGIFKIYQNVKSGTKMELILT